jgi:hypothetical protein
MGNPLFINVSGDGSTSYGKAAFKSSRFKPCNSRFNTDEINLFQEMIYSRKSLYLWGFQDNYEKGYF